MKRTIENHIAKAIINSNGAYVDGFEVDDRVIFFPKVMVKIEDKLKLRGGMHVCAPNFGADKKLGRLDIHGFARDLDWEMVDIKTDSVELILSGVGDYEEVDFKLSYKLVETSLLAKLSIINNSKDEKYVAPGFHPYFYSDHKPVVINDQPINNDDLEASIFSMESAQRFVSNGNNIEVIGLTNVNEFVFWTDFRGDYICVEPTYSGDSFANSTRDWHTLKPGEEFLQEIKIKVNLYDF